MQLYDLFVFGFVAMNVLMLYIKRDEFKCSDKFGQMLLQEIEVNKLIFFILKS